MKFSKTNKAVDRRKFISSTVFAGLGMILPQKALSKDLYSKRSSVVVIEDANATTGIEINADAVQQMVDNAILALTGIDDVGEAWKALLPDINSSSIIAIKVDCRSESLATHPEVSYAVCKGLSKILIDETNFPTNNIHIYDNGKAYLGESGYRINTSSEGVQCYMATEFSSEVYTINGTTQHVCQLLHDDADYLINIGVLKNHATMGGVSLCMENHLGSIDSPIDLHTSGGDLYIGELNAIEVINKTQVLNILDCIFGAAEGGPFGPATFVGNKIIMSADPIAVDYLGRELLIKEESSTVHKATYIDTATKYGIGTNNPKLMDLIEINNTAHLEEFEVDTVVNMIQNQPNPFIYETFFEFCLDEEMEVRLEIFSSMGLKVKNLIHGFYAVGKHSISWKGDNNGGKRVQKGLYVGKYQAGIHTKSLVIYLK